MSEESEKRLAGLSTAPRDCASHELCRGRTDTDTQTRLKHTPRPTWLLNKKVTRQGRQTVPLHHARSIRRRNRRGGLHAILSGDRLCGECSPPPGFPTFLPRVRRRSLISASRLRTRDARETRRSRERAARSAARTRRCASRPQRLQGANSHLCRGGRQVESRGASSNLPPSTLSS